MNGELSDSQLEKLHVVFEAYMQDITNTKDYVNFLNQFKTDIQTSRVRAALAVNKELILLYWRIGNGILERQKEQGWGSKVIDHLSQDLLHEFPEMKGLGSRNMKYMRKLAEEYTDFAFVQQLAAQIPWFHNCVIMDKLKDHTLRVWYIQKTIENGWSRNILSMQIESQAHKRLGLAQTNPWALPITKRYPNIMRISCRHRRNFNILWIH